MSICKKCLDFYIGDQDPEEYQGLCDDCKILEARYLARQREYIQPEIGFKQDFGEPDNGKLSSADEVR